jgi:hypothetical protein
MYRAVEPPRATTSWERRYLLTVIEEQAKPSIHLGHRTITLAVHPGCGAGERAKIMHEWHESLRHGPVPKLVTQ